MKKKLKDKEIDKNYLAVKYIFILILIFLSSIEFAFEYITKLLLKE